MRPTIVNLRRPFFGLHGLIALLLVACADRKDPLEPDSTTQLTSEVAGCYELTLGAWIGPPRDSWDPPSHFELSRDPHTVWEGQLTVKPTVTSTLGYHWGLWQQPKADSIVINFSAGYVGTRLHLKRVSDDRMQGIARAWTDTPTPMPSATASLQRTSCPDPVPMR